MKEHTRVVVIGGGIVGAAVLYHLTKLGWSDVVLVERKQLTAGSTWHAAGGFHAMNSDLNVSRLQSYGISVYKEVEEISGQDVGMHLTGGINIAATQRQSAGNRYDTSMPVKWFSGSTVTCSVPRKSKTCVRSSTAAM
jgi:dimethylglycine dehydrogenase